MDVTITIWLLTFRIPPYYCCCDFCFVFLAVVTTFGEEGGVRKTMLASCTRDRLLLWLLLIKTEAHMTGWSSSARKCTVICIVCPIFSLKVHKHHKHGQMVHTAQRKLWDCFIYLVSIKSPNRPFGSFQIIVGLLELSDVFVKLLLDAARLAEVVLQHGDLLVALRVLLLHLLLRRRADNMYWTSDCMHLNTWLNSSQSTPPYIFQCSIHFPFPFKKKAQQCDPFIHQLWDNWHDKHHRACLCVWPTSADKVMTELQPAAERPDSPLVQQVQLTEFKSTNAEINLKLWFSSF